MLGSHPVHCGVCSSVPGYYRVDVSNISPLRVASEIVSLEVECLLKGEPVPAENCCVRGLVPLQIRRSGLSSVSRLSEHRPLPLSTAQNPNPLPSAPLVSGLVSLSPG